MENKLVDFMFEEIIINQTIQLFMNPVLDIFFIAITYFGNPMPWFVLAAWLFWLGKEKKSFTVMSLLLMSTFVSGLLKMVIARPRPEGLIALDDKIGYSMPSGHSTISGTIAAYGYLSNEIKKNYKYLLILLAILTGISRLYLGVHFLSDVIAGLFIGAIVGWIVFKLESKINKMHFHISKLNEEFLFIFLFVLLIIFDLFIPAEYYGAFAILGYFVGYAIYRHTDMAQIMVRPKTRKQEIIAISIGTVIFGALGGLAYLILEGLAAQITFFAAGIFVTLIWPLIITKTVLKREKHKAKKRRN
jgi:undecaprenyl-diphosphatase